MSEERRSWWRRGGRHRRWWWTGRTISWRSSRNTAHRGGSGVVGIETVATDRSIQICMGEGTGRFGKSVDGRDDGPELCYPHFNNGRQETALERSGRGFRAGEWIPATGSLRLLRSKILTLAPSQFNMVFLTVIYSVRDGDENFVT